MLTKSTLHIIIVSVAAVILTACGSSKTTRATGSYKPSSTELKWPDEKPGSPLAPHSEALLSEARTWLGVPYKFGGNDRKGVDCSGLVLQVYKDALGIPLPRNSREQSNYCTSIAKGSLIPGDLIFFATGKDRDRVSHVGIFIGDNLMIHASASKGVILSDINAPYYSRTYAGSGIVEKYHAMLGEKSKRPTKNVKPSKPSKNKKSPSMEGPVINIPRTEATAGYTLTPVESLPQRAVQPADTTVTNAETTVSAETTVEITSTAETTAVANSDTTVKASETPRTESHAPVTPVKPVTTATTSTAKTPEPTAEEARAAVLNSIKEKEL